MVMIWKHVQGQLLAKQDRGEPYSSLLTLSDELGCVSGTIRKAIKNSVTLKGWRARSAGPKAAPKATSLSDAVTAERQQTSEPAPDDVLPDDDVDNLMARLIDQAKTPEQRAELNALNAAGRRELAAAFVAQNLDNEPSPLAPDKPGQRPKTVRQYKRA